MAEPFLSEIRLFSFNFAPKGSAQCNGQLMPINQNQALFALLGTTFGGDGRVNFALPDYRGRTPIHVGSGHILGERGGAQAHTLAMSELPTHTHVLGDSSANASAVVPTGNLLSRGTTAVGGNPINYSSMAVQALTPAGGDAPPNNMMPYLTGYFNIALQGVFPPRP